MLTVGASKVHGWPQPTVFAGAHSRIGGVVSTTVTVWLHSEVWLWSLVARQVRVASKVSPQNRLKTCQACHAGAGANFANFDPHADRHSKSRSALFYYAARFMEFLLLGVFAFFGIHTVFWFYRELRERFARAGPGPGTGNSEERH